MYEAVCVRRRRRRSKSLKRQRDTLFMACRHHHHHHPILVGGGAFRFSCAKHHKWLGLEEIQGQHRTIFISDSLMFARTSGLAGVGSGRKPRRKHRVFRSRMRAHMHSFNKNMCVRELLCLVPKKKKQAVVFLSLRWYELLHPQPAAPPPPPPPPRKQFM